MEGGKMNSPNAKHRRKSWGMMSCDWVVNPHLVLDVLFLSRVHRQGKPYYG
jgi:hypothetical protein